MKKSILTLFLAFTGFYSFAQDSTGAEKWQPTVAVVFDPVPVYHISGTDTGFINALSIDPKFTIRHKSGLGIAYSPHILTSGPKPGIYMHSVTAGLEQYDRPKFDIEAEYSHYFFTNTDNGIPYSPLTNEIYTSLTYKKWWVRPHVAAGIGFGNDTTLGTAYSSFAYDIGASAGINHDFGWGNGQVNFDLVPSLLLNAGTDEYFSFLSITKYITHTKQFIKYVKSATVNTTTTRGNSGKTTVTGRGRGNNKTRTTTGTTGTTGTTTTTTTTTATTTTIPVKNERFGLSNMEFNIESSMDIGSFTVRPTGSIYLPVGASAGSGVFGDWRVVVEYNF